MTHHDEDFMATAAIAVAWSEESLIDEEAEAGATRLRRDLHAIYDSCMPRSGVPRRAGAVYWWSERIARLREACIRAQRRYTRSSGGRTKSRWLVCMRLTAKRGGPCNKPSRRRRDGLEASFWPASTLIPGSVLTRWYWTNFIHGRLPQRRAWILGSWRRLSPPCSRERQARRIAGSPMRRSRSLNRRKKSHVTPRDVGARTRGSPRKNWPRLSGGSERGKLWVPMESRPACGRTSPGSWPRNYYVSLTDACLGANSPFCGKRHGWSRCRSQDALRTSLPPIGRSAFWAELASYWREWWRSLSSRICPGVFLDCTTASLASGGDGLRPTLQPVSASWLRGPSSAVTWSWLCRWTWSTPSTASSGTGYAGPSSFIGYADAYPWSVVRAFLWDRSIVYTVRGEGMTERAVYHRGPAGLRARSTAMEHRVRRGASSADASGLGAGVLCRRHVGAGLGRGVGRNRPSGGTGCDPYGRRDQGIGANGVPWEIWGNVVLPQGRSRDASSGLSPEVGGGWDRGRKQHERPGPDPRQSLDLPRSLRAPGTNGRGDGECIRTFAASAGRAWRRNAPSYAGVVRSRLLNGARSGQRTWWPAAAVSRRSGGCTGRWPSG